MSVVMKKVVNSLPKYIFCSVQIMKYIQQDHTFKCSNNKFSGQPAAGCVWKRLNFKITIHFMINIIFSEVIHEQLVISTNNQMVWRSAASFPNSSLTEMFSKWKNIVHSLILFGVRYKQIPTITISSDTFKKHFEDFVSAFESTKLSLLFMSIT